MTEINRTMLTESLRKSPRLLKVIFKGNLIYVDQKRINIDCMNQITAITLHLPHVWPVVHVTSAEWIQANLCSIWGWSDSRITAQSHPRSVIISWQSEGDRSLCLTPLHRKIYSSNQKNRPQLQIVHER